jgi:hypothetical protein
MLHCLTMLFDPLFSHDQPTKTTDRTLKNYHFKPGSIAQQTLVPSKSY